MKQMPPINIPKIQKAISKKHKEFLDGFGTQIEKVAADNRLLTDSITARLYHILLCFREEGVIDDIQTSKGYPKKIVLSKNGFDNYVYVITNGKIIRIEGYHVEDDDFKSDVQMPGKNYRGVNDENYDWEKFAMELLDYIHLSVYDRKDVAEAKLRLLLEPSPAFFKDVTVIDNTKKDND